MRPDPGEGEKRTNEIARYCTESIASEERRNG